MARQGRRSAGPRPGGLPSRILALSLAKIVIVSLGTGGAEEVFHGIRRQCPRMRLAVGRDPMIRREAA